MNFTKLNSLHEKYVGKVSGTELFDLVINQYEIGILLTHNHIDFSEIRLLARDPIVLATLNKDFTARLTTLQVLGELSNQINDVFGRFFGTTQRTLFGQIQPIEIDVSNVFLVLADQIAAQFLLHNLLQKVDHMRCQDFIDLPEKTHLKVSLHLDKNEECELRQIVRNDIVLL